MTRRVIWARVRAAVVTLQAGVVLLALLALMFNQGYGAFVGGLMAVGSWFGGHGIGVAWHGQWSRMDRAFKAYCVGGHLIAVMGLLAVTALAPLLQAWYFVNAGNVPGLEAPVLTGFVNVATTLLAAVRGFNVGSSRVDLQACKLEYSIVSPK